MSVVAFIGDEISALGYRLGGAEVHTPAPRDVRETFKAVLATADVVMITAEAARHVPQHRLDAAQSSLSPLVIVINDARNRTPPPDIEERVHTTLGLDL